MPQKQPKEIRICIEEGKVYVRWVTMGEEEAFPIGSPEAFKLISAAWLRSGWDAKHVYSFTWLGRPLIQLPEDMLRIQEVIYQLKPQVIVETGVAHGGGLVFYASLLKAMQYPGKVIGIDCHIRPQNRIAIEQHELADWITLIEGDSISPDTVEKVRQEIPRDQSVLVVLDSNHSKAHVLAELRCYGAFVSPGSYIVAADGIMESLVGAPRSEADWEWNNPRKAVEEFLLEQDDFAYSPPSFCFNEGVIKEPVTYWPGAWLMRKKANG